jgi:hypothetical protein
MKTFFRIRLFVRSLMVALLAALVLSAAGCGSAAEGESAEGEAYAYSYDVTVSAQHGEIVEILRACECTRTYEQCTDGRWIGYSICSYSNGDPDDTDCKDDPRPSCSGRTFTWR